MKRNHYLWMLIAGFLLFTGVTYSQDVTTDHDEKFDFSKLKTFAVKVETSWGNPLGEKRVIEEVEKGLIKKGWTKTDEGSANALVLLHGVRESKQELSTFYTGYGGWGWGGWGGMSTAHTRSYEYTQGTLVVDMFDTASKQLVFRGVAQAELSDKPEKNQKKAKKAVEKMFKKFPPGSESKK